MEYGVPKVENQLLTRHTIMFESFKRAGGILDFRLRQWLLFVIRYHGTP
jgi:hypothetical protein